MFDGGRESSIGDRIKMCRLEQGLDKIKFVERVGGTFNIGTLNRIENGTKPRPNTLAKIAQALGESEEYLISGNRMGGPKCERGRKLLEIFEQCSVPDQQIILDLMNLMVERNKKLRDC